MLGKRNKIAKTAEKAYPLAGGSAQASGAAKRRRRDVVDQDVNSTKTSFRQSERGPSLAGSNSNRRTHPSNLESVVEQPTSSDARNLSKRTLFRKVLTAVQLEKLSWRLGRSLRAGIPLTRAFENEARFLQGILRSSLKRVINDMKSGHTAADAVAGQTCFPPLFVEMVRVGEETGQLPEALLRMADHYRNVVRMRRTFLQGITWPVLQLTAAAGVISVLFLVIAWLESRMVFFVAPDIFILGLSPIGNLVLFWGFILMGCLGLMVAVKGSARGWFGRLPMRLALRLPLLGNTIKTLCLSRFSWSFGMATGSGMDAKRTVCLAVRSTDNHFYTVHSDTITRQISQGSDYFSALDQTGAFPKDLLQTVQVGEATGALNESLERLSDDYCEQAELSLRRISQLTGFGIFILVTGMMAAVVALMYAQYLGSLNRVLQSPLGTAEQIQNGEKSNNPVIAAKNEAVKDFIENNEDFKQIKLIYEHLINVNTMDPDEFLDGF